MGPVSVVARSAKCDVSVIGLVFAFLAVAITSSAAAQRTDGAIVKHGAVIVDGIQGLGIGLAIDTAPVDGLIDDLVVLQGYGAIPDELPLVIPNARILLKEVTAVVVDRDGSTLAGFFLSSVSAVERNQAVKSVSRDGIVREELRYVGVGFTRQESTWGDFAAIRQALADPDSGSPLRAPGDECHAGGVGATSCSIGCDPRSCSTTCSNSMYACCYCKQFGQAAEVALCKCNPNGGGGGSGGGGSGSGSGDGGCTNNGSGYSASCQTCRPST